MSRHVPILGLMLWPLLSSGCVLDRQTPSGLLNSDALSGAVNLEAGLPARFDANPSSSLDAGEWTLPGDGAATEPSDPPLPARPDAASPPPAAAPPSDASMAIEDASTAPEAGCLGCGPDATLPPPHPGCGEGGASPCAADAYCHFKPQEQCGDLGAPGSCVPRPSVHVALYDPVCGCDGRSYDLDGLAFGAGTSVRHVGACTEQECEQLGGMVRRDNGNGSPSCPPAFDEQWELGSDQGAARCCYKSKD